MRIDGGRLVAVVYMDFSKSAKLDLMGFRENSLIRYIVGLIVGSRG